MPPDQPVQALILGLQNGQRQESSFQDEESWHQTAGRLLSK